MNNIEIGSVISFGRFNWRVLDIKDGNALIITEEIIEQQPFHDTYEITTWENCSLRRYLNGEFYEKFSALDRSKITPVINKNIDNNWYGSNGGNDTNDNIFLLSIEEVVCKYFGDSSKNLNSPSAKQRYWFQRKDVNNIKRRSIYDGYIWWWWLRSPGRDNRRAVYIHGDGNIGIQGNGIFRYSSNTIHPLTGDNSGGVRPALWLKLN
ncbi:MAG: hypothetical protein JXR48_04285 [Candidatus Delongbacteria bacterium]|nr:hypothetical protein [Candidatus Delongbacteria bacterium]MBN2834165.1 hypothetical protein [Candidatus Delongbacteria bacterium]